MERQVERVTLTISLGSNRLNYAICIFLMLMKADRNRQDTEDGVG